jgi:hypothetical protein
VVSQECCRTKVTIQADIIFEGYGRSRPEETSDSNRVKTFNGSTPSTVKTHCSHVCHRSEFTFIALTRMSTFGADHIGVFRIIDIAE